LGDHIKISLLLPKRTEKTENIDTYQKAQIANKTSNSSVPALRSQGKSGSGSLVVGSILEMNKLPPDEKRKIMKRYFSEEISNVQFPLDDGVIDFMIKTLVNDSETLQRALDYHNRQEVKDPKRTFFSDFYKYELANEGMKRYFRFKPKGSNSVVNARVLDIHRWNRYPENAGPETLTNRRSSTFTGVSILVEWLGSLDKNGIQEKHIAYLKQEEIETVEIIDNAERIKIHDSFKDTLSPMEIQTKNLAEALRVKTFGFTEKDRVPGIGASDGIDPLTMMSNISHIAMKEWNLNRFGDLLEKIILDLTTKEEREHSLFNIIDLMGKLNPRFVLEKFKTASHSWVYIFVITEDGQLKVSPHGHWDNNLKAQNLRLAGGKRVFAAGKFTIDENGKLSIDLKSNSYQDIDVAYGRHDAFRTYGNEGLDFFIVQAFLMQTGKYVENINSSSAESYYENDFFREMARENNSTKSKFEQRGQYGFGGNRWEGSGNESDFSYTKSKFHSHQVRSNDLKWNAENENEIPLEFQEWAKRTGSNEKIDWAHYVLGTDPDMPFGTIKRRYRKLILKFHADRNPSERAERISPSLTVAMEIIEEKLKENVR
jgi:hypothetical protein